MTSPEGATNTSHTSAGAAIEGLAGVIVWTAPHRFEVMRDFYRDTLRLPVRTERDGFISFAWPRGGDPASAEVRLNIVVHSQLDGPALDPLRTMINLAVADIDAVHARLVEAGVRFLRPPEREHFGGRVATLEDPDGNLLQLLEQASA